jgi:hypothetical protein
MRFVHAGPSGFLPGTLRSRKIGSHRRRARPAYAARVSSGVPRCNSSGVRHSATMARIMSPGRMSISPGAMKLAESVAMEEAVVHEDASAKPAGSPTPSAPTTTTAEVQTEMNPGTPAPSEADSGIVQSWPRIKRRRGTPKIARVVGRNIDDLRIRGLDLNRRLSILIFGDHLRLRGVRQLAGILGAST